MCGSRLSVSTTVAACDVVPDDNVECSDLSRFHLFLVWFGCSDSAVNSRVSFASEWIIDQICSMSDYPPEEYCAPPPLPESNHNAVPDAVVPVWTRLQLIQSVALVSMTLLVIYLVRKLASTISLPVVTSREPEKEREKLVLGTPKTASTSGGDEQSSQGSKDESFDSYGSIDEEGVEVRSVR